MKNGKFISEKSMLKNKVAVLLGVLAFSGTASADLNTDLMAYYEFEGNTQDESGQSNHATVVGNVTYQQMGNSQGIHFDNPPGYQTATQYVTLPNSSSLQALANSSFSVVLCYQSTDTSQQSGRLLGSKGSNSSLIYMNYNAYATKYAYSSLSDGTNRIDLFPGSVVTTDGKYHCQAIIGNRETQTYSHYVNTKLTSKISMASLGALDFTNMVVGATDYPDTYAARLTTVDSLRIYKRALSPAELSQIYYQASDISGTVKKFKSFGVTCENMTTGQTLQIPVAKNASKWDCENAGLDVKTNDKISVTLEGVSR